MSAAATTPKPEELDDNADLIPGWPFATRDRRRPVEEHATEDLLARRHSKAQERRFSGAPITDFGKLP
jgi:hypothetical protein